MHKKILTKSDFPFKKREPIQSSSLCASSIETPLGLMLALADTTALYRLEFVESADFSVPPSEHTTPIITMLTEELNRYFQGTLTHFTVPLHLDGSEFQKRVWSELITVPFGQTRSYASIAHLIGKPTAFRAVANANGANTCAIIIPCHRIINTNGKLGGYSAGIARKEWLLEHEKKFLKNQ